MFFIKKLNPIFKIIQKINRRFSKEFFIGLGIWTISFFMPYIILGYDSYIRIHDTLEGELIWLHILKNSGYMHSLANSVKLDGIMDGLPRNVLPSGYTIIANLCHIFDIFYGYIIGHYLFKTLGFISFYLFIKRYMTLTYIYESGIVFVCLLLTSIQFFTPFGISIMGMPLLAYGFARLYYQQDFGITALIFFIFPFCSSFVWSGIEIIFLFNVYLVYLFIIKHDNLKKWIAAWVSFIAGTILANLQFIYGMLFLRDGFRSHRVAYYQFNDVPNIKASLAEFFSFFFSTHYHVSIFVSTLIFGIFILSYYGIKKNPWSKRIFLAIIFIVLWQAFYNYIEYFTQNIVFIKSFRFNRFGFLLPFLWFLILLISLDTIARFRLLSKTIPLILGTQFLILFIGNDETQHNYKKLWDMNDEFPSYREYLALDQFREIKKIIPNTKDHKIVSLGLSPTIAQYHDYATLDGLFSVYNLNYKNEFRKIMEKELEKNPLIREKFDTWGNRCYLYSDELGVENVQNCQSAHDSKKIYNLEINTDQIKKLGGRYIFSACEVKNAPALGLQLLQTVGRETDFWKIYLYKL